MTNRITQLFNIRYPVIQAGMIWTAGWRLASAVSNAGGLGLIGSGSMYPDVLREHIRKCKQATDKPFGVNVPLIYPDIDKHIQIIIEERVKIVFSSAGNPNTWTPLLKQHGVTVVHVVPGSKYAIKAEAAGCDAVVAEGFEAGGHNGREETTTICLVPGVCQSVKIPVMAAGGIASGRAMMAAFALGAEGVQIGSRFAATEESSAHDHFKQAVIHSAEGDTMLTLKELIPVRMLKNKFYTQVKEAEERCAGKEELQLLLGRGRAKKGIFEGNLDEGELEIGMVSALIRDIRPAAQVLQDIWKEFCSLQKGIGEWKI
ncbi:MAG: nitronate monooxygenase [Chitinophagaceae bacterium]|nr:MAG: nitronate monooxygenase [Chitinophagaceae bacterium]